jgi:hypothetical protein
VKKKKGPEVHAKWLSACLFGLQLNKKQLELVGSEKRLELDSW